MGSGGSTNTVQQADPWSGQQRHLLDTFNQARYNYQNPPSYFPNATYVPFSQQSEQALGMAQDRALGGSPVEGAMQNWVTNTLNNPGGGQANDYLQGLMGQSPQYFGGQLPGLAQRNLDQTLQGDFLSPDSNPWLQQTYDRAASSMMPSLNATFGGAGRTGSGTHGMALGQGLADLGTGIFGGNYQQERGRLMQALGLASQDDLSRRGMDQSAYQFQNNLGLGAAGEAFRGLGIQGSLQQGAAGLAPTAAGLDWQNIARLRGVGSEVEGMAGQALTDQINRYNFGQNLPDEALARYVAAIQGNYGGAQTSSQSADSNPLAGAAGGALTGVGLGSMMGAGSALPAGAGMGAMAGAFAPWALGGALLGGLMF